QPRVVGVVDQERPAKRQVADRGGVPRKQRIERPVGGAVGGGSSKHGRILARRRRQGRREPRAACFARADSRYRGREGGGGRATRQPGQVRKEAALTSTDRVARQPPTPYTAQSA